MTVYLWLKFQQPYDTECEGALGKQTHYMHFSSCSSVASILGLCPVTRAGLEQAAEYSQPLSVGGSKPARVSEAGTVR